MPSRRRRTRITLPSLLVLAALVAGGYLVHSGWASGDDATAAPTTAPTRASRPSTAPTTTEPARTRAELTALPVKGSAPSTGYDRTGDFGSAWLDVDHNGCDTRNDVLARDLTDIRRDGPCTVLTGTLVSPYTGATIAFRRGETTSTAVQIDHVVALEDVWRTGGQQLNEDQRETIANDPLNLFAVDQHSNEQKRSGNAATWLPANKAFRCEYVTHQVEVKTKYHLWVVPAERDAIARVLDAC